MDNEEIVYKVFISQPMRGLSYEDILKTRNTALDAVSKFIDKGGRCEELETLFINDNGTSDSNIKKHSLRLLGNAISKMTYADIVLLCNNWRDYSGCIIEYLSALLYDIPVYEFDEQSGDINPVTTHNVVNRLFVDDRPVIIPEGEAICDNRDSDNRDMVAHPNHYNTKSMECKEIIKVMVEGLPPYEAVLLSNAIKYMYRYNSKGKPEEDLSKAVMYLTFLKEFVGGK